MQQYLQSCRLRKAAIFMKDMNMSPGQAGCAVGYADVYSFSRSFKSYFKMTLTEFKKQAAKNLTVVGK
jgi:AraC-like DNA-binding protein